VIHANPVVPWQQVRGNYFAEGFRKVGIPCTFSGSRARTGEGVPVLLGTTFWHSIETDGGPFILVDRCSFGDTEKFVQLVWNGHGRRGDHRVPEHANGARWQKYGVPLKPWSKKGKRVVLCGQTASYSPTWPDLNAWYRQGTNATHFRTHPAGENPTALPVTHDFKDTRLAITLNSSVGVQAVLDGIPTVTMDDGAMAWDVTSHSIDAEPVTPVRQEWAHRLAWTQWTDDEIKEGTPWASLL
jgi:hypothetical protein